MIRLTQSYFSDAIGESVIVELQLPDTATGEEICAAAAEVKATLQKVKDEMRGLDEAAENERAIVEINETLNTLRERGVLVPPNLALPAPE